MPWTQHKPKRSCLSETRKWPFWVSLAVCSCICARDVSAQLTQQQVQQAVQSAITASRNVIGYAVMDAIDEMMPIPTTPQGGTYLRILQSISNNMDRVASASGSGSAWSTNDVEQLLSYLVSETSGDSWLLEISDHTSPLQFLGFDNSGSLLVQNPKFTFSAPSNPDESLLNVYDEYSIEALNDLIDAVRSLEQGEMDQTEAIGGMVDGLDGVGSDMASVLSVLQDLQIEVDTWRSNWLARVEEYHVGDEDTSETITDFEYDTSEEMSSEDSEMEDEYDDIPLPSAVSDYEPTISEGGNTPGDSTLGLDGVSTTGDHSALVRLVGRTRAGGPIPEIEIDFGRDSALVSGLDQFATFFAWLYPTLFGVLLSVKGVHMYRVCRTVYLQTATGSEPTIRLAFNPF